MLAQNHSIASLSAVRIRVVRIDAGVIVLVIFYHNIIINISYHIHIVADHVNLVSDFVIRRGDMAAVEITVVIQHSLLHLQLLLLNLLLQFLLLLCQRLVQLLLLQKRRQIRFRVYCLLGL